MDPQQFNGAVNHLIRLVHSFLYVFPRSPHFYLLLTFLRRFIYFSLFVDVGNLIPCMNQSNSAEGRGKQVLRMCTRE